MDLRETRSGPLLVLLPLCLWGAALAPRAQDQDPAVHEPFSEADLEFFESKVRPLLIANCYECHSSQAKRIKGDFKLDSWTDLMRGGESGEVIVPGDVEASPLVEVLRYAGKVQMPPKGKLDPAEIALLESWVRRGAPMPDVSPTQPAAAPTEPHWAFESLSDSPPPKVHDSAWCANPIDQFVLADLEAAGLRPAARADRRTLLRRLSFDLIGLPPSAEELERFENDKSADAWEHEVDRLLASPHFGERWGRSWLDLARYSDSNGLDENLAMSTAYRYRDWVVRALNQDLPYDKFLTWQLAGDLLAEPQDAQQLRDQLTATAFLVLGPKMLAEQDKEKLAFDVVDEQIDVAFRTFQGLTLGCARCHDHKFDPLSQRDYTAVAGMFKSTETMSSLAFVSRWNERELASAADVESRHAAEAKLNEAKAALAKTRSAVDEQLLVRWTADSAAYLLAAESAAQSALLVEAEDFSRGNLIRDDATYGTKEVVIARTGSGGLQFAEYDLTFDAPGRRALEVRVAAEESRPLKISLDGVVVFEAALGEISGSWRADGQRWIAAGVIDVHSGRNVLRLERDGSVPHLDRLLLVPASESVTGAVWPVLDNPWAAQLESAIVRTWALRLESAQRGDDPIFGLWSRFAALEPADFETLAQQLTLELRAERDAQKLAWNPSVLRVIDGLAVKSLRELAGRYQTLLASVDSDWREQRVRDPGVERLPGDSAEALRKLVHGDNSLFHLSAKEIEPLYPESSRAELVASRSAVEALERTLPPMHESAPGVRDAKEISGLFLMRRGNHLDKGTAIVPRGVPQSVASQVDAPLIPEAASGRLQLAQWMLDPRHPLTSRVAVNRLWQGHFGAGLVRSSSNFGLRGDHSSHPALLDWLARELMRREWSQKSLHKLICMSSTYQTSSEIDPQHEAVDPTNRLLAHQNRRRLEAEAVRDALLSASGTLDATLGGSLLEIGNGDYVTNDQSKDNARYEVPRRSLYLPIIRNAMLDLFSAFDYPDSSVTVESRPSTTSPNQALYLMNSPLVLRVSEHLAAAALKASSDGHERVGALYRTALGRAPAASETLRALDFVAQESASEHSDPVHANVGVAMDKLPAEDAPRRELEAWSLFAQVLLVSNEFLFVP